LVALFLLPGVFTREIPNPQRSLPGTPGPVMPILAATSEISELRHSCAVLRGLFYKQAQAQEALPLGMYPAVSAPVWSLQNHLKIVLPRKKRSTLQRGSAWR